MLTETQITAKLNQHMRKDCHAMVLNLHGHSMQAAGWPDVYISHWFCRCWVEYKSKNREVEPLQRKVMTDLVKRKDSVYVIRFESPKLYLLSDYEEKEIVRIHGNYKEAARSILDEIGIHQKLCNN